ncbi:hypothetical protein N7520_004400 [Penicillium odoratum]|uniref:uncharacterized protein n=1 Tax=Penicillium odoratum TaxID=1167516 RepID=UPI002547C2B5|nr:uncharacterized protein N7520_004400 [Penicillium odoratum]KAJ5764841.1 hypothetical protein N7520_004400 [Penicillium odoratum]
MQSGRKYSYPEPLSESEKKHFSKYGKTPGGVILSQKAKKQTQFDSGDFALSAAHRATYSDAVQIGEAHSNHGNVSHHYAHIPTASNVEEDATRDTYRKSVNPEGTSLQHSSIEDDEDATKKEDQDSYV